MLQNEGLQFNFTKPINGINGNADAHSATRIAENSTGVDVFNVGLADLNIAVTSAILISCQQTWHTLCTKQQVVKQNTSRRKHAGKHS